MDYSLTGGDIIKIVGRPINLFTFDEIADFNDIDDLFKLPNGEMTDAALILYKTSDNYGHWTCITKTKNRYDFLDSYGDPIDTQRNYIDKEFRENSDQELPHILKLISKRKKMPNVHYNSIALQKMNPRISTCGRYCALFMKYKMGVEEFGGMIMEYSKKISPDQLVTVATQQFLGK